uniref:Phosphatidic acid phosphatase type 2/haloperoxidase domain-containing protein n=7 Tax=Triticinae TaxID=1648030 RepID=A0A453KLC0_AEGTS
SFEKQRGIPLSTLSSSIKNKRTNNNPLTNPRLLFFFSSPAIHPSRGPPSPAARNTVFSPASSRAERWRSDSARLLLSSDIMADIQLGCYTIKSHGAKVARLHMYDWIILLLLAVIDGLLNIIEPFHRFIGKDMMTDLRYPLKGNTVPFWAVPLIGIVLPCVIFGGIYFKKKNIYDLHHGILGILYSVLITAVITDAIKDGVGRPRPDFFWRCFPDGKDLYDNVTTGVLCHGEKSVIKEGHKSFPSGHSSWSFAGLGFLTWYLTGKIAVFDRKGHIAKLCIIVLPLLTAALVAVSRVDDYWHHWQDVVAGAVLGLTVASFCYLQFFPYPYDADGLWPHAYTLQLAEARNSGIANSFSVRPPTETEEGEGQGGIALRDTSPILDTMESGRRYGN